MKPLAATIALLLPISSATSALAQVPDVGDRQTQIEEAQSQKSEVLAPYVLTRGERLMARVERVLVNPTQTWHPFFDNAYRGGGFALGAGYMHHVSAYSWIDVRGSYSIRDYKRVEAEFVSPRLFHRRAELSVLGGWRDATEVAFYGVGADTSSGSLTNYGFERPYASALLTVRPTRRVFLLRGGLELTRWDLKSGAGSTASVEEVYAPAELPGLQTTTSYVHSQGTVGVDWRIAPGYARRGGFYGVTLHDYHDRDDALGFQQVDYEVIQHIPVLREAWVVSLRGLVATTWNKDGQEVPFFMLPSLGGGSDLRGFSSWRFRDRHSLLLQAEWRIMANRYFDTAVFYDAGKVAARTADLDLDHLKTDYGFGARFHTPFATALRIDVARGSEGTRLVFGMSPAF
jgi:hypothetical protein